MAYPLSSSSTISDRLGMICDCAQKMLEENPVLAERVVKVTINWVELSGSVVPNVELVFSDSTLIVEPLKKLASLEKETNKL